MTGILESSDHGADQLLAAAGDDHVDVLLKLEQLVDRFPIGQGDDLNRRLGERVIAEDALEDSADGQVGEYRLRAAPQDDGVAGLEAEGGRVGGDVRAGFVDDPDHPEGNPHPADGQAVRPLRHGRHLSHRIGQGGHLAQPLGDSPDGLLREREAVDHRPGKAEGAGAGDVPGIFPHEELPVGKEGVGHRDKRPVLDLRVRAWQGRRRRVSPAGPSPPSVIRYWSCRLTLNFVLGANLRSEPARKTPSSPLTNPASFV